MVKVESEVISFRHVIRRRSLAGAVGQTGEHWLIEMFGTRVPDASAVVALVGLFALGSATARQRHGYPDFCNTCEMNAPEATVFFLQSMRTCHASCTMSSARPWSSSRTVGWCFDVLVALSKTRHAVQEQGRHVQRFSGRVSPREAGFFGDLQMNV